MAFDDSVKAKWLDIVEPCPYLPEQTALMEYAIVGSMTSEDYAGWINERWRKMGQVLFRPRCLSCQACQPVRVLTSTFKLRRVHKRVMQMNTHLRMHMSNARVTQEQIDLVDRYERFRQETVGWPESKGSSVRFLAGLAHSPLQVLQMSLYDDERLVAFCFIDALPDGFSLVNSFWEPELMKSSLGVCVILSVINEAKRLELPHVYLGYYVAGCRSMQYKAGFYPAEVLTENGWQPFQP